jgi:hypothetical protein
MTDIWVAVITGVFGIITGGLLTYVSAILKFRKDLEADYDKDLRSQRIRVYKDLWKRLELVARYDRPKPLNTEALRELTESMRIWYFEKGGLYLSEAARTAYFNLKNSIQKALSRPDGAREFEQFDIPAILTDASLLRAQLTKDVGTRKSSPVADS